MITNSTRCIVLSSIIIEQDKLLANVVMFQMVIDVVMFQMVIDFGTKENKNYTT